MSIFYYILDGASPKKRVPFSGISAIEQFGDLNEALKRYRELPDSNEKVLGLSDGLCALELVRCVPLFPTDREGTSILSSDPRKHPFWAGRPEAILAMETCKQVLKLRYMTQGIIRVPIPDAEELPEELKGKRLWMKAPHVDPMSAIKSVTVIGKGPMSPKVLRQKANPPHLVFEYWVDLVDADGAYDYRPMQPWMFDLLAQQTMAQMNDEKEE